MYHSQNILDDMMHIINSIFLIVWRVIWSNIIANFELNIKAQDTVLPCCVLCIFVSLLLTYFFCFENDAD